MLLRLDAPSDIRAQGVRSQRYLALSLLLIGVIFCTVVLLVFERTVLSRLLRLGSSVLAIGTGGDPSRRVSITGKDQIAYLGAAINGMLDTLARSTEQLRASERRNEAFLDAVPDVIFRVTRDGTILDARSSSKMPLMEIANNLVGENAEHILAFYSFISPEHFDQSLASVETALDSGQPQMLAFHVDVESGQTLLRGALRRQWRQRGDRSRARGDESQARRGGAPQGNAFEGNPPSGERTTFR